MRQTLLSVFKILQRMTEMLYFLFASVDRSTEEIALSFTLISSKGDSRHMSMKVGHKYSTNQLKSTLKYIFVCQIFQEKFSNTNIHELKIYLVLMISLCSKLISLFNKLILARTGTSHINKISCFFIQL